MIEDEEVPRKGLSGACEGYKEVEELKSSGSPAVTVRRRVV